MKTTMLRWVTMLLLAFLSQTAKGDQRPIQDFVANQGTFIGGLMAWIDPSARILTRFDYAGLLDAQTGGALGTAISGSINETPLPDGRARVLVRLHAQHALASAIVWQDGTPLFGNELPAVLGGAEPSFGDCSMEIDFINTAPGASLPDLIQLAFAPLAGQEILQVVFLGTSHGLLADDTSGLLHTTQTALIRPLAVVNENSRVAYDAFPAEKVIIRSTGN